MAIIDGHEPIEAGALLRHGLIEPILGSEGLWKLTAEGRRYYSAYRERLATDTAHLE